MVQGIRTQREPSCKIMRKKQNGLFLFPTIFGLRSSVIQETKKKRQKRCYLYCSMCQKLALLRQKNENAARGVFPCWPVTEDHNIIRTYDALKNLRIPLFGLLITV